MASTSQAVAAILRSARGASGMAGMLCLLTASLSWAPHVLAQQAPAASEQAQPLEEVTVTGSRIKRTTDFTTPTPTTVIDMGTMENLGITNIGEALAVIPANVSEFTPANTGNSNFFTGAFIPDLRGLNPFFGSRTLTLIDSRRAVQTNQGDSFDLNFLPQILVSRIDTVTGGASAAYGSGAIGGVINVILDRKLVGGRINADIAETNDSDGRDKHLAAAYGLALFDNRVHLVVGGEYEKQDSVGCQTARSWCAEDKSLYVSGTAPGPGGGSLYTLGTGLRTNAISNSGVLWGYNFINNPNLLQATADGTSVAPYEGGSNPGVTGAGILNNTTVVGGQGNPIYQYTSLSAPLDRGLFSALMSAEVTDNINFSMDANWGKVSTTVYSGGPTTSPFVVNVGPGDALANFIGLGGQNIVGTSTDTFGPLPPPVFFGPTTVPTMPNAFIAQAAANGNPSLLNAVNAGYDSVNKDWTAQTNSLSAFTTTVKRITAGFDGKVGQSSWTWEAYGQFGQTEREQLVQNTNRATSFAMALDSVLVNGVPECRVTAAGGGLAGLTALTTPGNPFYNPLAAGTYANPAVLGNDAILSQGCVPLNPFGTQPLSPQALAYSFGNLDERLQYTQSILAANSSGDIWRGIGAGPFSLAVGFEHRHEVGHNDEVYCPQDANYTYCEARIVDFQIQYGTPFGGNVEVNEEFAELNLPLLKDKPFAHLLTLDVAARNSGYDNHASYGIDVTPAAFGVPNTAPGLLEAKHNLATFKVSALYEPIEGVRFRGSLSRDSRAPNFRELYYGQVLQSFAVGGFGSCTQPNTAPAQGLSDPCTWNLLGNTDLRPETADTTTLGIVLSPVQVPGLQVSADWFHIKLKNAIEQANVGEVESACANGSAGACSQFVFNGLYYNPALYNPANASSAAVVPSTTPGAVTGAAAWQAGFLNANVINATSYNGAAYEVKGVDFSLNYMKDVGALGTLDARLLTTWTGEQVFQSYAGSPVISELGQTGAANNFLNDENPSARWTGNLAISWVKGGFSLTPNVRFVGQGTLTYNGITQAENPVLYNYALYGYPDASNPSASDYKAQLFAKQYGWVAVPFNRVPSYFVFGLNAAYNFESLPGIKRLSIYTQIDNLLNRQPPFANSPTGFFGGPSEGGTNPIFFDTLGLRYRAGFRMAF
ncbi:MAG: TonB-dependent receptor [Steroidobacteraceae bacterium]